MTNPTNPLRALQLNAIQERSQLAHRWCTTQEEPPHNPLDFVPRSVREHFQHDMPRLMDEIRDLRDGMVSMTRNAVRLMDEQETEIQTLKAELATLKEVSDAYGTRFDTAVGIAVLGRTAALNRVAALEKLLDLLIVDEDCSFDHDGDCKTHGFSLDLGEKCPNQAAQDLLAEPLPIALTCAPSDMEPPHVSLNENGVAS